MEAGRHVVGEAALEVDQLGQRVAVHPRRAQVAQAAHRRRQAVPAQAHALEHVGAQVRAAQRDGGEGPALLAEGLAQRHEAEARDVAATRMGDQHDVPACARRAAGDALPAHRGHEVRHVLGDAQEGVVLEAPGGAFVERGQAGPHVRRAGRRRRRAGQRRGVEGGGGGGQRQLALDRAGRRLGAAQGNLDRDGTRRGGLPGLDGLGDRARLGVEHGLETAARGTEAAVDHDHLRLRALRRRLHGDAAGRAQRRADAGVALDVARRRRRHAQLLGPPGLVGLQARLEGGIAVALRRLADASQRVVPPAHDPALQALAAREFALEAQQRHGHQPAHARMHAQHHVGIGQALRHRRLHGPAGVQRHQLQRRAARVAAMRAGVTRGRVRVHRAARAPVHARLDVERHAHGAVPPGAGHVAAHQGGERLARGAHRQDHAVRLAVAHGQRQRPPLRQVDVEAAMLGAGIAHRGLVAGGRLPVARMVGAGQPAPGGAEVGLVRQQLRDAHRRVLLAGPQQAAALLVEVIEHGARRQGPIDAQGTGGRVGNRGHRLLTVGRA